MARFIAIGLFRLSSSKGYYEINPLSGFFNSNHLTYFKLAGQFLAKAIIDNQLIDAYLSPVLCKHILGLPVVFSDLQYIDEDLYKNLLKVKETKNVEDLG